MRIPKLAASTIVTLLVTPSLWPLDGFADAIMAWMYCVFVRPDRGGHALRRILAPIPNCSPECGPARATHRQSNRNSWSGQLGPALEGLNYGKHSRKHRIL